MKKSLFCLQLLIFLLLSVGLSYGQTPAAAGNSITISGSRFSYDLLRQWIHDFNEEHPDVVIQIVPRETPFAEQANLVINAHNLDSLEIREGYEYIKLGRYSIFPIANEKSGIVKTYRNKPLREKELKELFFDPLRKEEEEEGNAKKTKKQKGGVQLYTRQRIACSNTAFATHYGFKPEDLKGKSIVGEDKHLVYAVLKDTAGVSYSIPTLLYDLETRKLKKGIAILKTENLAEAVAEKKLDLNHLDSLTAYLEQHATALDVPLTYFHISLKKDAAASSAERRFLQYILTKGQARLHEFGYLSPEEPIRNKSIQLISF